MAKTGQTLFLLCGVVLTFASAVQVETRSLRKEQPDVYRDATALITSKGFPVENHYVTTEDGYILNVVRIPGGRGQTPREYSGKRPVVFLQHGLMGACTNFLTNTVNQSLAYNLADAGADVWIGNSRGNIYSRNHTKLSTKSKKFWDFSFDEMVKYDLPATINYIVEKTGNDQISYVGHSQGTIMAFAAFSENQKLASHIKNFFALAPVARVKHIQSPVKFLAPLAKSIGFFLNIFGHGEFMTVPSMLRILQAKACSGDRTALCSNLMFVLFGFDEHSFDQDRMPVYASHNPAGTSVKNLLHLAQEVNSGKFQKFDYGRRSNMDHYGQSKPPEYNVSRIKVPLHVFRGGHDWLVGKEDYIWLKAQLPNIKSDTLVPGYQHLDFTWAKDVREHVNEKILDVVFGQ